MSKKGSTVPKPPRAIPPVEQFLHKLKLLDEPGIPEQFHIFQEDSAQAVRAALAARRPLLVRGEPGVGKTQLAEAAARVLEMPFVPHVVDSRTESRDLLWSFDAVMRLADSQITGALLAGAGSTGDSTESPDALKAKLKADLHVAKYVRPGPLWWAFNWEDARKQAACSETPEPEVHPPADYRNGVVVLIDEIDKADTDVPNGLLEALGSGRFRPLGREKPVQIKGPPPLVVITTNEERVLPGAFVRRCLVHHLKLPEEKKELAELLIKRAMAHFGSGDDKSRALFEKAADLLIVARELAKERLVSPLPGQAEYLDLLRAVRDLHLGTKDDPFAILETVRPFLLEKQSETRS
jgi:MoxR-like ATPase